MQIFREQTSLSKNQTDKRWEIKLHNKIRDENSEIRPELVGLRYKIRVIFLLSEPLFDERKKH